MASNVEKTFLRILPKPLMSTKAYALNPSRTDVVLVLLLVLLSVLRIPTICSASPSSFALRIRCFLLQMRHWGFGAYGLQGSRGLKPLGFVGFRV